MLSNSNHLHWPRVVNEMGLGRAVEHHCVSHVIGRRVLDTVPEYSRQVTRGAGSGIVSPALLRRMDRIDSSFRD